MLLAARCGQVAGEHLVDSTLSGFVGAAVMVPVAHLVGRARPTPVEVDVLFGLARQLRWFARRRGDPPQEG